MKRMSFIKNLIISTAIILLAILPIDDVQGCSPLYKGPTSDHFDGSRFFNKEPDHSFLLMLKWLSEMETVEWPEWIDDPPQPKPIEYVVDGKLRITFINHATLLIQIDGLNILTDPIWSERSSPFSWVGPKRVRAPGVKIEDLPKIDFILISHDHYDHLDFPSLERLNRQYNPTILVGLGVKALIDSEGSYNVIEMDWWQEYPSRSNDVKFTFVPSRHNSGRGPFCKNRTLWGGFVIEGKTGRLYFAGDTAYGQFIDSIKNRFGRFCLTIFPIGSYEKRWFMESQHMNPDDAVRAHKYLNSKQSVGMHFGTFLEHPEQAIDAHEKDLLEALKKYEVSESEFWILKFGEGRYVGK